MNNFEEKLKYISKKDFDVPENYEKSVNDALNYISNMQTTSKKSNKKKTENKFIGILQKVAAIILVGTLSVTVYAATGGTIEGIPAADWLGIKFSSKYLDYKENVKEQIVMFEETSVELVSTVCNEGITIIEFSLKLSEDDCKKLKVNENAITEEYLDMQEKYKITCKDEIINNLKNQKYNEEFNNRNYDILPEDINVSEEEIEVKYKEKIQEIEDSIKERENSKLIPVLSLNYEQKGGTYNYDKFNPNMDWYASIYIDDEPYYVRNFQKVEKINDYEYKIYTMYMIDEDVLKGKNEYKISLKNNKISSIVNWVNSPNIWRNDCQWFARNNDSEMMKTPKVTAIDLPGEFEVNVSKESILNDSIVIDNPNIKSEFRNITHTVEKVVVSPIQTIVRINHSATKQSSNAFANRYDDPNIEHLPLTREYKVYDDSGNELSCFSTSNKNTLIYSDGRREDYDSHDLPNKKYNNATWENIQYLLIENVDTKFIKIVPIETIRNPVNESDEYRGEIYYEMEPLIINIK